MLFGSAATELPALQPMVSCTVCGSLTRTPLRVDLPATGPGVEGEAHNVPVCSPEHVDEVHSQ